MINRLKNKKGMLVLVLAAGLVFVAIVFASISNRMRAEALITNRVSINERLNQFASAIGRLAIRKLQRDIELVDTEYGHGQKIVKFIMDDNQANADIPLQDYTNVLEDMAVVKDLKKIFEEKYGSHGKIGTLKVEYKLHLGNAGFSESTIPGVELNPFERNGHVDMIVTVGIPYGVTRKYTVRKDFIFARLLAAPFYRFTLFCPTGATLSSSVVNACEFNDSGEIKDPRKRPFVCLNRRLAANDQTRTATNYVGNPENVIKNLGKDAFIKNGWIYLGAREGSPAEKDINDNSRMILNVAPGSDDDDLNKKFGEYFHFYYDKNDSGWLIVENWSDYFTRLFENFNSAGNIVKVSMVNYGIHPQLFQNMPFAGINLFKNVVKQYEEDGYKDGIKPPSGILKQCSSMHLFGSPKHCTPTLIFGPINRRYLRAFALFFPNMGRVFPLPSVLNQAGLDNVFKGRGGEGETSYSIFNKWYVSKGGSEEDGAVIGSGIHASINYKGYYGGCRANPILESTLTNGIGPLIIDNEPYMKALVNMSDPRNPANAAIPTNPFISDPEGLCNSEEFEFTSEHKDESKFLGKFDDMRIDYSSYLKPVTTYTIGTGNKEEPISIKNNSFIQKHFFAEDNNNKYFLLNQIIRIDGDLDIDEDLIVAQGGIIIASGTINIKSKIINKIIEYGLDKNDPNNFGYLTLIGRKGIKIDSYPGAGGDGLPPKLEAFLIAGLEQGGIEKQQVNCNQAIRIIGGVAADRIDDLVRTGSIVEWGMEPNECTDYSRKDFYGLTLGPRDIELYTAE